MKQHLKRIHPGHSFLAEEPEFSETNRSDFLWIIDPLDGTTNYAHHFPQACVSIALEYSPLIRPAATLSRVTTGEGTIILGGVYDPFRDELFWAEKGKGAWLEHAGRRHRLSVSPARTLSRSLLLTGFPYDRRERIDLYLSYVKALMHHIQGIRRAGAAALDLCWVAAGRVEGYWEWRLKPWDVAAGSLIVQEAGGKLTDFSGKGFSVYGEQTLATNGRIHRQMLRVMRPLAR